MPKFAEFFAGIGLVRLALEPLGWECAFANDVSEKKAQMYRARFSDDHLVVRDVAQLTVRDLPTGLSLVTASFPCIDLSLAGNRNGLDGAHSGTFWPFVRLLRQYCAQHQPPGVVLIENVVGLLTSNDGRDLERIIKELNELDYRCDVVVVDAKWFVPQSRPRVFVIGLQGGNTPTLPPALNDRRRVRPEAVKRFVVSHPALRFTEAPLPEPPLRSPGTLLDVLETVPRESDLWWQDDRADELFDGMHDRHRSRIRYLQADGTGAVGTIYRRVRNGRAVGEVRIDGLAGCLRTPAGGSSVQFLAQNTGSRVRVRRMTGREYARLQGVPDSYPIEVPDRHAMFGFGDAICVPAVRWLAEHAFEHLVGDTASGPRSNGANRPRLFERRRPRAKTEKYSYPAPGEHRRRDPFSVAERSAIMRKVRAKNTSPELQLRGALWRRGLRYRVDVKALPGRPDIAFTRAKVAIFVDGEFWHGKKLSAERLAEMSEYWQTKIARNVERDRRVNAVLTRDGWRVLRLGVRSVEKNLEESVDVIRDLVQGAAPVRLPAGADLLCADSLGVPTAREPDA